MIRRLPFAGTLCYYKDDSEANLINSINLRDCQLPEANGHSSQWAVIVKPKDFNADGYGLP